MMKFKEKLKLCYAFLTTKDETEELKMEIKLSNHVNKTERKMCIRCKHREAKRGSWNSICYACEDILIGLT